MHARTKTVATYLLWYSSLHSRRMRSLLAPWGTRTNPRWYSGRVGSVHLANSRRAKLTHMDENYLSFELHWKGWEYYEPTTILLFQQLLRDARTFYDVGANIGYFSLFAASENPQLSIVAFEPNAKLYSILTDNVRANALSIHCEPRAVSRDAGRHDLYVSRSDMSASLDSSFRAGEHVRTVAVETTTVDEYVALHSPRGPLLLKIDVEGHEPAVLEGAAHTLRQMKPDILLEVVEEYGPAPTSLLKDAGYRFYQITNTGLHPSDKLAVCRQGDFLHSNYFVSPRDPRQVDALFRSIQHRIDAVDLSKSSIRAVVGP